MNKIELSFDNLVYSLIVNKDEDIIFELPHKTPNKKHINKNENEFVAVNDVTIRVFINTINVSTVPNVIITGQDDSVKFITTGSFELLPSSIMEVTFSTVDGGSNWLVNSCNENGATAEGAQVIANSAKDTAISAKQTADSAVEVSTNAKNIADIANSNSQNAINASNSAVNISNEANSKSQNAVNVSVEAKSASNDAKSIAEESLVVSNEANTSANEAQEAASNAVNASEEAKEAAKNAVTASDNAINNANLAKATANQAKSTAEDASTLSIEAKEIANNANNNANEAKEVANTANQKSEENSELIEQVKNTANGALQKELEGYQTINSGLVLANQRKFLLQRKNGGTPVGMFMGYYPELVDEITKDGLEQVELGTTSTIMCLNHCGATFTDSNSGETKTVDKHIRVDCKDNANGSTYQEQIAYISDLENTVSILKEYINVLSEHISNIETMIWYEDTTSVDPVNLPKLPVFNK